MLGRRPNPCLCNKNFLHLAIGLLLRLQGRVKRTFTFAQTRIDISGLL